MKLSNNNPFIIAEIGVNHNGKVSLAKKLIDKLSSINVSAVKLQYFKASDLVTKEAKSAPYQRKNNYVSQFDMLKSLELNIEEILELKKYASKKNIEFLCSFFDHENLKKYINLLNLKYIKIPSGEINNTPYLQKISSLNKKVLLSTGMATLKEINYALNLLIKGGTNKKKITLLQCTSSYPVNDKEVNINNLISLKNKFKTNIGFSDHSIGSSSAMLALALGSTVFEKHVTLNKKMKGPDHKASSNIQEFKKYVEDLKKAQSLLGSTEKKLTKSEKANIFFVRKSIVAKTDISKNDKFTVENITLKRPARGLSPLKWHKVLNRKAKKKIFKR